MFGEFLEDLAIFISEKTYGGHKSSAEGLDLEFIKDNTHYVISIKSGQNWGNSSQVKKIVQDFDNCVRRLKQSSKKIEIKPVLGICYGKAKTVITKHNYWKIVGQNFWYLISGDPNLYLDIVKPIGHMAKENNEAYLSARNGILNRLTAEFIKEFCYPSGEIDWNRLVEFNSQNLDIDSDF